MYNIVTVYIFFNKYSVISIKNLKCILDSNNIQPSYRKKYFERVLYVAID